MSYPPPPPADKQNTHAYPQPGEQAYGQAQAQAAWPFPGETFQDPGAGHQGPQGQPDPQWQGHQGHQGTHATHATHAPQAARRTSDDAKGFFAALFDFSFTSYVTPKIIKVLYVLYTIWMVIWAVIFARLGFKYGGAVGGTFVLLIVVPVFLLLTLGVYRIILEFFIVIHRMNDELKAIRQRTEERG